MVDEEKNITQPKIEPRFLGDELRCPVCGAKAESMSIITGKYEPCGHTGLSKKDRQRNRQTLKQLNRVARNMGWR